MVLPGSDGPILAPPTKGQLLGGIRPENFHLAEQGIAARVRHAEYLGADTVVACAAGDVPLLARLPGRVVLADGAPVCLATEAPIHLFDAASGGRIELAATAKQTIRA
jgi:sn-glycerol 3-phosphate transport system ATP-binding protein